MKKVSLILLAFALTTSIAVAGITPSDKEKTSPAETTASKVVVKGSVVDLQTKESLAGVALEIAGTKTVVYTDFDGNFEINNLEPGYYNIIVRIVSYQSHLIENVYLQQGNNTLQPIKLAAN